ncbi:hypothetical protein [Streptomyces sp. NPDC058268]
MPDSPSHLAPAEPRPETRQYEGLFQEPQHLDGQVYDDGEDEIITP